MLMQTEGTQIKWVIGKILFYLTESRQGLNECVAMSLSPSRCERAEIDAMINEFMDKCKQIKNSSRTKQIIFWQTALRFVTTG